MWDDESKSIYDSEWGEYEEPLVEENVVEETVDDYDIENDDEFDYSSFEVEDEYADVRNDPVLSEWIPIENKVVPSNIDEEQMYNLAKAWYSGSHKTPDNVVPGKSAGNRITVGEYAGKALKKFRKTGNWKSALGAVEGPNNKLDTPTQLNSSAIGRLQIIKGTREGAYSRMGIPRSEFNQAEQRYKTDANFQSMVEDAVYADMMGRIQDKQYGGTMTPNQVKIPSPNLDIEVYNQSPTDYLENDFSDLNTTKLPNNNLEKVAGGLNDVVNNLQINQKEYGSLASGLIDTAADSLANVQNNYNLRKYKQLQNQKKFLFSPTKQNDVPIFT